MEVVTLKRRRGIVSMDLTDQSNRQLELERQAHQATRQDLQTANRTIQDLRTKLAHAEIAINEFRARAITTAVVSTPVEALPEPNPQVAPVILPSAPQQPGSAIVVASSATLPEMPSIAPTTPIKRGRGRPPKATVSKPVQADLPLWRENWSRAAVPSPLLPAATRRR